MLTCPMCKKTLADATRHCPRCSTDLSLLVDYASSQESGVARAEQLTRAGQLGEAVWAYLEVLEVDPENAEARRQIGRIATAVRQFDGAARRARWFERLRKRARFRRWPADGDRKKWLKISLTALFSALLLAAAFFVGYHTGSRSSLADSALQTPASED